jgi:dipeptidyl aminopeptidase/acylaminoacyl peptidase
MKTNRVFFKFLFLLFTYPVVAHNQDSKPAEITIDRNGIQLKGKFFLSEGSDHIATVILLHGFPGGESDVLGIGNKLVQSGMNALTFNYSGTYQSDGKCSWDNMQLDIAAAYKFLHLHENINKFRIDTNKIYLGGWCNGGGMALTFAAYHPEVTAVFSIAPSDQTEFMKVYTSNPNIKKMIDNSFNEIAFPKGHLRFETGASPWEVAENGIDKINPVYDLKKCAPFLVAKDILLIGGWDDKQTTVEAFILPLYRTLQNESAKNVRLIAFQDDHYFGKTRAILSEEVINWLKTVSERK